MMNEERSPYRRPGYNQNYQKGYGYQSHPKPPPMQEETIKSASIQVEKKTFILTLSENPRGRLLRITEEAQGRRNCIIVPATGLADFQKAYEQVQAGAKDPGAP